MRTSTRHESMKTTCKSTLSTSRMEPERDYLNMIGYNKSAPSLQEVILKTTDEQAQRKFIDESDSNSPNPINQREILKQSRQKQKINGSPSPTPTTSSNNTLSQSGQPTYFRQFQRQQGNAQPQNQAFLEPTSHPYTISQYETELMLLEYQSIKRRRLIHWQERERFLRELLSALEKREAAGRRSRHHKDSDKEDSFGLIGKDADQEFRNFICRDGIEEGDYDGENRERWPFYMRRYGPDVGEEPFI